VSVVVSQMTHSTLIHVLNPTMQCMSFMRLNEASESVLNGSFE